jgi:cell wall-associated NlpC family hydrolase
MLKMLIKISSIAFLLLFSNCFQAQNKMPEAETVQHESDRTSIRRLDVISFAKDYLGTTYKYAGISPVKGFDCSGFVYFVYKNFNIDLPRGSKEYKLLGTALKPEEFKVGDILVFYGYKDLTQIGHVGIICEANGMKSKFIHSSSGKAYGVTISNLDSDHYARRFYKCIDVIQEGSQN